MKTTAKLILLLIACPGTASAQPTIPKPPSYGPSWFDQSIDGHKTRPEKVTTILLAADHDPQQAKTELSLKFWADFPVETGHAYELRIQFRPHTTLKEPNKMLGTKDRKDGIAYTVAGKKADADWNGLEGRLTATVKALAPMTNRPHGDETPDGWHCLAVEPQVYDATDDRYVTKPMFKGYLTMIHVVKGDLIELVPLADWIAELPWADKSAQDRLVALLPNIMKYALSEIDLESSFGHLLDRVKNNESCLAKFVAAIPDGWLHPKSTLRAAVVKFAESGSPVLKAAAAKRLAGNVVK